MTDRARVAVRDELGGGRLVVGLAVLGVVGAGVGVLCGSVAAWGITALSPALSVWGAWGVVGGVPAAVAGAVRWWQHRRG